MRDYLKQIVFTKILKVKVYSKNLVFDHSAKNKPWYVKQSYQKDRISK